MSALVGLIKRIGIFMVASQAIIHFAPGQKYEKYLKLIVGIMILLQLLSPLYDISMGTETDWSEQLLNIELEIAGGIPDDITDKISNMSTDSATIKVIEELEEEIKSKLNDALPDEKYRVTDVKVSMRAPDGGKEKEDRQYTLEKIRVIVWSGKNGQNNTGEIEKIQISKIAVGGSGSDKKDGEEASDGVGQETENSLRERFCNILGIGEEYMEVSIYGTVEENNR